MNDNENLKNVNSDLLIENEILLKKIYEMSEKIVKNGSLKKEVFINYWSFIYFILKESLVINQIDFFSNDSIPQQTIISPEFALSINKKLNFSN